MQVISNFLDDKYTDNVYYTHVSLYNPKGSFMFNNKHIYDVFWNLYCKELFNSQKQQFRVGLAERPMLYVPVLVDFDLKLDTTNKAVVLSGNHLYDEESLLEVVSIYQSILRQIVEDCSDDNLLCVVLEKPPYTITQDGKEYLKSGFHLHFPSCFLNKNEQETHLIPRVLSALKNNNLFEYLGIKDASTLIDKNIYSVNWLLYGSSKGQNMEPYKVSKVINAQGRELQLEEAFRNYLLYDCREQFIDIRNKVEYYLPRILSILPYGRETQELKEGLENFARKVNAPKKKRLLLADTSSTPESDLELAKKLVSLLADHRSDGRWEWLNVGWTLYCIGNGSQEAFEIWDEFSRRSDKYDEDVCIREWNSMVKKDKTIRSLHYLAKVDSPLQYEEFMKTLNERYVNLEGTHWDIAQILYNLYKNEFVCANIRSNIWYQFINHKWREIDGGIFLRTRISKDIVPKFSELSKSLHSNYVDIIGDDTRSIISCSIDQELAINQKKQKYQKANKIIVNLKSHPFKKNVMNEAADEFYDEEFSDKLNKDAYLFGFKNGVYDLREHIIRDGRPDDFLSKCAPVNYFRTYTKDDPEVKEVELFFLKVFPDEELREYFLDRLSTLFVGGNFEKKVWFLTGETGDNGKSITTNIIEQLLGNYCVKLRTTVLSGKKAESSQANPEMVRTGDGVRLVIFQELNKSEEINCGIFKELSGSDSFWARDLFERGRGTKEIIPLFKMFIVMNKLPKLDFSDKASWNRVRVIPFESTFVLSNSTDHLPPPDTFEEQLKEKRFHAEADFHKKIPFLLEPLAWLLLERWKNFSFKPEPKKVTQATELYRKNNDIFRQYIEENILDDGGSITLADFHTYFKTWFSQNYSGHKMPDRLDIKDYLTKLWGEPEIKNGIKWNGYRQRLLADDMDDDIAIVINGNNGGLVESKDVAKEPRFPY